jgi:PD-(D/E)XK endonuclease
LRRHSSCAFLFMEKSANSTAVRVPAERTYKQQGEVVELAFLHRAVELGFAVTKPYGDSEAYDFVVDSGVRLWRVQVRSTHGKRHQTYFVSTTHNPATKEPYTPDQIDFLAAHTAPDLAWYIIPATAIAGRNMICLYPHVPASRGMFECFREAWCLMGCMRNPRTRSSLALEPICGSSEPRTPETPCPLLQKNSAGLGASKKRSRIVTHAAATEAEDGSP